MLAFFIKENPFPLNCILNFVKFSNETKYYFFESFAKK